MKKPLGRNYTTISLPLYLQPNTWHILPSLLHLAMDNALLYEEAYQVHCRRNT